MKTAVAGAGLTVLGFVAAGAFVFCLFAALAVEEFARIGRDVVRGMRS